MTKLPDILTQRIEIQSDGCWLWTGGMDGQGKYGRVRVNGRRCVGAHVAVYEIVVGKVPDGLELDHLCENTRCVNPDHLEPVTRSENMRRRNAAVTHCKRGHEFTSENTYFNSQTGKRACRTCERERNRKRVRV